MSEPQEDTVEDINEISEKVIMEPISISEEISEDEKKLRTKIADLISNIVGKIKMTVGKLFRIVQNFLGIPKRILKKMQSLALTIRNFCDKINWWKEFLDHPRTKEALSFLWKKCKKTDLSCASDKDHRKKSHLAMKIRQLQVWYWLY